VFKITCKIQMVVIIITNLLLLSCQLFLCTVILIVWSILLSALLMFM